MMLKIPAIDLIDGNVVRLYKGNYDHQMTYSTDPVDQALRFEAAGFQRIHVVDLEGAKSGEGFNRESIADLTRACTVPIQTGGGIRTEEDVRELIGFGVDYLILGTVVLKNPDLVTRWIQLFGPDHFIISLDLRSGKLQSEGWLEESDRNLAAVISEVRQWGIQQIICTDVDRDGTLAYPNYATYSGLLKLLPEDTLLIAAGGVSEPGHITRLKKEGVAGAIIGRALYEGRYSWEEILIAG